MKSSNFTHTPILVKPRGEKERDKMSLTQNLLKLIPLTLITISAAQAQGLPAEIAHRFAGYEPSVVESEAKAKALFEGLDTRFKSFQLLKLKAGTDLFIESKQPCVENVPFSEFEGDVTGDGRSHDKAAHCYIVRAPMYDVFPEDIDAREKGHKNSLEWDINEVYFTSKSLSGRARKEFLARVGL